MKRGRRYPNYASLREDVSQCVAILYQGKLYNNFKPNVGNKEYFKSRIMLPSTNEIVDKVNVEMVEEMNGDKHTFISVYNVGDLDSQTMFPIEYLNSLNFSGLPKHKLGLKKNIVVILLRNMDIKDGYWNGIYI